VGNALFEELVFADGLLTNGNLLDYRVPRVDDMPAQMEGIIVENGDGPGPYGAKGCGEGAQAATPAAIATALADAGVLMNELPFTPERVWGRIQQIKEDTANE
jgi:CO/xanthine dehydrogenase Mo-binding subunit